MKDLFPRIFGHEAAGIIESVGEGVEDLVPGDHVTPLFQGECSDCKYCLKLDKTNLCGKLRVNPVIGVDINQNLGKGFGVTDFVNPKDHDKPIQEVGGVDYSFECIGSPSLMQAALESTHDAWGMTIIVGVPSVPTPMSNDPVRFLFGHVLKGTILGGFRRSQIPALVDRYIRKEIKVDEFVTHTLPFERINDAFQLLLKGDCLRCVLSME